MISPLMSILISILSSLNGAPVEVTANEVAVRLNCVDTGLYCQPFAPPGDDCDEMTFYRIQAGLPDRFDKLGYRESNCRNEEGVRTYCCYGYWQLYFTMHMNDAQGSVIYEHCQVDEITDYNGDEPLDKQKQACVAKGLFDILGYSPWVIL